MEMEILRVNRWGRLKTCVFYKFDFILKAMEDLGWISSKVSKARMVMKNALFNFE